MEIPQRPSALRSQSVQQGAINRDEADVIIRGFHRTPPVDVLGIAKAFEINVYVDHLGQNVSGLIRRDPLEGGKSGYLILVNSEHPSNRQRFTIAHELAHYILHCGRGYGEIKDDEFYRALPGPLEREANEMAADILMPWVLINRLTDMGITDLYVLAKRLAVSRQALAIRLGLPYDQDWN